MVADIDDARPLFFTAIEKYSPAEWSAYLDGACGANANLRQRVDQLLAAHVAMGSIHGGAPLGSDLTIDQISEQPGTLIGPYKLLEQIGEGGMGLVYMAEQQRPMRRLVALKLIKPGMDSKQVIARFEAEKQALAMMDHENIAKVFEAGTTDAGRFYFAMELVRGIPINEFCDQKRLSVRERLALFIQVSQAVQHAHQKGIIHRDLKPSNVLVTMHDVLAVPKVIDFGIAKALGQQLTEHTLHTGFAQLVGTPLYMSPEQAEMNQLGVDTRSDVYSLGVLLYELLTGTTPFDKDRLKSASFDELRRIIREEEPETVSTRLARTRRVGSAHHAADLRPSSLVLRTFAELDWIVMKALEKDRSRRYESASALAADIQRYLSDEPVLACPPTTMYRFQKFARKHKPALATAAAISLCLILGTTVSAWQAARATTAEAQATANEQRAVANEQKANSNAVQAQEKEQEAIKQRDEVKALNDMLAAKEQQLQRNLYTSNMNLARHAWEENSIERVKQLLAQHRPKPGETDLRGFEWHYLNRLCNSELLTLNGHTGWVSGIIYSPDGKRLASASFDKTIRVWDAESGQQLLSLKGHEHAVVSVAYSPDGKRLASMSHGSALKLWDAESGMELLSLTDKVDGHNNVAFSPDGKRVACGAHTHEEKANKSEYSVQIWDAESGQELLTCKGHTEMLSSVAYSPDGKRLASASFDSTVRLWDAQTGQKLISLTGHTGAVTSVAFSPDGKRLAGAAKEMVMVWDAETGKELHSLQNRGAERLAFSPDGQRLVTDTHDGSLRIWDLNTAKEIRTIKGGGDGQGLAFSPDGRRVAGTAGDQTVKVWDAQKDQENFTLQGVGGAQVMLSLSPDFRRLASGSWDGTAKICDAQTGKPMLNLKGHTASILSVAFSLDGKRLASSGGGRQLPTGPHSLGKGDRGEVKVWDTQTGQELMSLRVPETISALDCVIFSPDGKRLAGGAYEGKDGKVGYPLKVWDIETGQELLSIKGPGGPPISSVAFSADGKCLAASSHGYHPVKVWDAKSGQELLSLPDGGDYVAYSTDGKRLASGSKVWDAKTGQQLVVLQGGDGKLVFSPDGKRLVSGSKVWDAETGQELLRLKGTGQPIAFSEDGHRLVTSTGGGEIKIYDATPLPEKP